VNSCAKDSGAGRRRTASLPILIAALVLLPFVNPSKPLSIQILIWGALAISYNLLLGYTGLLSFGHAIFFGLGAYGSGLYLKHLHGGLWTGLLAGTALAMAGAVVVGWFCLRRRGVYFGMLTLAFGQMFYFVAFQADRITGGDDGLQGVPTPGLSIPGMKEALSLISIRHPYHFYFFCLAVVVAVLLMQEVLVRSPFGRALQAIRESEERSLAVGYNTMAVQWLAFVISGAIAGLAGALNTLYLGFASIDSLSLETSGMVLIMTVLGGKGFLVGPFLGAGLVLGMQDLLSAYTDSWQLVVGAVFVGVVLLAPAGVVGAIASGASAWMRRRNAAPVPFIGGETNVVKPS
jgi:branched-chain amino acid transport system permease protein